MRVLIDSPPESPVFILGLHRSGTTWLYELLAKTGCFDPLTAYHVICFDDLLSGNGRASTCRDQLRKRFDELRLAYRGDEAVRLSLDTPEEYGFILDNNGAGLRLRRANLPMIRQMARVVRPDPCGARRLLLKNPWDFGHGALMKRLIPDAKFVFIHRNPFYVLSSMYRLTHSTVNAFDPYTAMLHARYRRWQEYPVVKRAARFFVNRAPGFVVRGLVMWARRAVHGYRRGLANIPPTDRMDVTYEELCREPAASISRVLSHLGVQADRSDFSPLVQPSASPVAAPVLANRWLIVRALREYAEAVGYDLPALARAL